MKYSENEEEIEDNLRLKEKALRIMEIFKKRQSNLSEIGNIARDTEIFKDMKISEIKNQSAVINLNNSESGEEINDTEKLLNLIEKLSLNINSKLWENEKYRNDIVQKTIRLEQKKLTLDVAKNRYENPQKMQNKELKDQIEVYRKNIQEFHINLNDVNLALKYLLKKNERQRF